VIARIVVLLLVCGQALVAGASKDGFDPAESEIRSAPEQVTYRGQGLILETYLWRDFMPLAPPDGRPLKAVVRIQSADQQPLPDGLIVERLWVIHDDQVWDTRTVEERPRHDPIKPYQREFIAGDGPKWPPASVVEVIVQLRIEGQAPLLLRAAGQTIQRTQ
jgi:hypothetical protein